MYKLTAALLLLVALFFAGCLKYDVRQELPTKITVESAEPTVPESPIECKQASCMAVVKEVEKKNVKWECSPAYKGANDDPRGTVYYEDRGDRCEVLSIPDTLCLKYDCSFDTEKKVGYYITGMVCGKRDRGYGFGIAYPSESLHPGSFYDGLGSIGKFKLDEQSDETYYMGCNAVSDSARNSEYALNCTSLQEGCYTCDEGGILSYKIPMGCQANMPIQYPYNAKGFEYNPILDTSAYPPDSKRIDNLRDDYRLLEELAQEYLDSSSEESSDTYVKGCEDICSEAKENPDKGEECNRCSREHANDDIEDFSKSDAGVTARGFSYSDLEFNKCNGLNPCVEIDRAGIGKGRYVRIEVMDALGPYYKNVYTCGKDEFSGEDEQRYFICKCRCDIAVYSTYKCTRPNSNDEYYYTYCKKTSDTSSQGGYVYGVHNFSSGLYKEVLTSENQEIPIFMLGQGPSFNDYELAKKLCKPSKPADIEISAGLLPFSPSTTTVFEGGEVCFDNVGGKDHTLHLIGNGGARTLLKYLEAGKGTCFPTGSGTNFTLGTTKIGVDDNEHAFAIVSVITPEDLTITDFNEMRLDNAGNPEFYYKGVVKLDAVFASADYDASGVFTGELQGPSFSINEGSYFGASYGGADLDISEMSRGSSVDLGEGITFGVNEDGSVYLEGSGSQEDEMTDSFDAGDSSLRIVMRVVEHDKVRLLYAPGPGEYTATIGSEDFSYVVYTEGDTITVQGSNEPLFAPVAISIPFGSKLCVRNEAPSGKKTLVLEKKALYEPNSYLPVQAKSSYFGLECCFDIKEPGIYRISDKEYPAGNKAYVVVFPSDVQSNIRVNDYDYSPYSSIAKKDDLICISNPVGEEREVEYSSDEGHSGSFMLPPLQDYCDYSLSENEANYELVDTLSGAKFYISTTGGDVLNIDAYSTAFVPTDGRVAQGGKVCINAVDSDVRIIGPTLVSDSSSLEWDNGAAQSGELISKGQKRCYDMNSDGLHMFRNADTGLYALVAVGDKNILYIVNGNSVPGYAEVAFPDYASAFEGPLNLDLFSQFPDVKVVNLDDINYKVYEDLSISNGTGFSMARLDLSVPDVVIRNNADYDISIKVYSSNGERSITAPANEQVVYEYQLGDYKMRALNVQYKEDDMKSGFVNLEVGINARRMISGDSIVLRPGANVFVVRRIGGIALSYYDEDAQQFNIPKNMLVIRGDVEGGSASALGRVGSSSTLGFGVQMLSGVPSKTEIMQARSMLAYDNALPVFVYSRIGDTDVNMVDPSIPENYSIAEGSKVNVTLADGISRDDVSAPPEAGAYSPSLNGWSFEMPDEDITFSVSSGTVSKQFNLKKAAVTHELKVSYDAYRMDSHGTDNYLVRLHNLAEDPRAVMLRPSDVSANSYCMLVDDGSPATADLQQFWSPQKMTAYSLSASDIDALSNHDPYVGGAAKVTDITLLPNMGYDDIKLSLGRSQDTDENGVGSLVLKSTHRIIPNTYTSKLEQRTIELTPGYITGMKDTFAVREYRIFTPIALETSDKIMRFTYVDLGGDVYSDSYSVLLRRYAPGRSWILSNSDSGGAFSESMLKNWKGSLFVVKGVNVFPSMWYDKWYHNENPGEERPGWVKSGCGYVNTIGEKIGFIVPFNNTVYPEEFAYSFPHIIGVPELGGDAFAGGVGKYEYLRSKRNDYVLLPQVVGRLQYGFGSIMPGSVPNPYDLSHRQDYGKIDIADSRFVEIVPETLILANGEIINDAALKFVDDYSIQRPCGRLITTQPFLLTGDFVGDYNQNYGGRTCGDKRDFEAKPIPGRLSNDVKNALWSDLIVAASKPLIIYNKYGALCGYPAEDSTVDEEGTELWYWCRATKQDWGADSQLKGTRDDNWYLANVIGGIDSFAYSEDESGRVRFFDLSNPVGQYNGVYRFINNDYYEFPETPCDTSSNPNNDLDPGNRIRGGIDESSLTNGILFMVNSIDPGRTYFLAGEVQEGVSEFGQGYAISDVFQINSESGLKAVCYGEDTFDGIQEVISPLGTVSYSPDMQGWYSVHESPYYPNLLDVQDGKEIIFSHISPFARNLADTELGDLLYKVPSFAHDGRMYRNTSLSMDYIMENALYADVYLYNLTVMQQIDPGDPSTAVSVDELDVALGDEIVINNTGPDAVVWYYGALDPCSEDDIYGVIQNKMTKICSGDYEDCIIDSVQYSVSPIDMDAYLSAKSVEMGDKIRRLELSPGEHQTFNTANELQIPNDGKKIRYLFYNPYSGKSFTVNVYKPEVQIELDISSFQPRKVSIPNSEDSRLCITNRDDEDRTVIFKDYLTGFEDEQSLSPGDRVCRDAQRVSTHSIIDSLTQRQLYATVDEIGSPSQLSILAEIAESIAEPKMGADNPVYRTQLLNPRAPATPSFITTELIDVSQLASVGDEGYSGLADQIAEIEGVCRSVKSVDDEVCGGATEQSETENIEHTYDYRDFSIDGCCCDEDTGICVDLDKDFCESYGLQYKYMCPYENTVYKQRCISTIPFYIHMSSNELRLSDADIENMKNAIDAIDEKLKEKMGEGLQRADMVGYIVVIDDPGAGRRGECTISSYLEGLYNVSRYALVNHGMPSIIIGFGINRNANEDESCWTNTEMIKQLKDLYGQDFVIMIGSGIIGMGQYCLVDTSCKPLSTGIAGEDYGLYYDSSTSGEDPFTYGVHTDQLYPGMPTFSQYAGAMFGSSASTSFETEGDLASSYGQFENTISSYSDLLSSSGISLPSFGEGSDVADLLNSFEDVNNPDVILENAVRKDPYARHWFDLCGNYYYMGEGQALMIFSESDIPKGQQGNMCDQSRLMELYKKYKCE